MSTTQEAGAVHPLPPRPSGSPVGDTGTDTSITPGASEAASLRASDAERAETVERLHQALAVGRLDLTETDERVTTAYAATHRHELSALLTDLPATDPDVYRALGTAPSWATLWALVVWRMRTYLAGGAPTARPTARQLRTVALLTALIGVWVVACAVLGAVLVGS